MKLTNIVLLSSIAAAILLLRAWSVSDDIGSVNKSMLRMIASILDDCMEKGKPDGMACLHDYAENKGIRVEHLMLDAYGRKIILNTGKCSNLNNNTPYSSGRNGIDECGRGDDVVAKLSRTGQSSNEISGDRP